MSKIDLNAIFNEKVDGLLMPSKYSSELHKQIKDFGREAIHQALVLASEKAKDVISTDPNSDLGVKKAIEQSILDIEKLIINV